MSEGAEGLSSRVVEESWRASFAPAGNRSEAKNIASELTFLFAHQLSDKSSSSSHHSQSSQHVHSRHSLSPSYWDSYLAQCSALIHRPHDQHDRELYFVWFGQCSIGRIRLVFSDHKSMIF